MGLWHIYSQANLTDIYPEVEWGVNRPPQSIWPSWFKGTYAWSIFWVRSFFYIPSEDQFCLWGTAKTYPNFIGIWPNGVWASINQNFRIYFDGETGKKKSWSWSSVVETAPYFPDTGSWGLAYGTIGSYERIYVTRTAWAYPCVDEVFWASLLYSGWKLCSSQLNPQPGYWTPGPFAIVNREDGYVVWGGGTELGIYKENTTDSIWYRQALMKTLGNIGDCCYENRTNCWWITEPAQGHKIGKLNYKKARHEILSSVQPQYDDVTANRLAFDTKRKRVAVLRIRPDDPDTGACRWALDFYRPIIKVAENGLTDPVPITSLRTGKRITFVAQLIGDVGEALPPHSIDVSMEAPIEGKLLTPLISSDHHGRACALYQALAPGDEKINLSALVNDGDPENMEW